MNHSIIDYKDLGFKTELNKAQNNNGEFRQCKAVFKLWLSEELPEDKRNALNAFNAGRDQYLERTLETKIQAYKCSEEKYFFILERGEFTYNSDLFCEYFPTLKAAQAAGFNKHDEIIKGL